MKKLLIILALILSLSLGAAAEQPPVYRLGDPMEDLSLTAPEGGSLTLYDRLKEKDLALILCCAHESDACRQALARLQEAALTCQDRADIITLCPERADNTLTGDPGDLLPRLELTDDPVLLAVDRFGVIGYLGGVPADSAACRRLMDVFLKDDYAQSELLAEVPAAPAGPAMGPAFAAPEASAAPPSGEVAYTIRCVDQNGAPVAGAMVQICDASTCRVAPTDADGLHVFTSAPCAWEIHVLIAPAGYSAGGEVLTAPAQGGEITLTLTKN